MPESLLHERKANTAGDQMRRERMFQNWAMEAYPCYFSRRTATARKRCLRLRFMLPSLFPGRSRQESGRRGNPMTRTWTIIASNLHLRLFMASSSDPPESPK
jgi:hypothetical protein